MLHNYFSSFDESYHCFLALSLPSTLLKLCAQMIHSFHDKMLLDSAKFTLRRRKLLVNLLPSSILWTLADDAMPLKCMSVILKVIPQKKKLPMNFFETFPECSPPSIVSKKTIKMIGHHSRLRDMMGQSYPIYACSRANHAHYSSVHVKFCGSSKHTLLK